MREFLNAILLTIGTTALTDGEFNSITLPAFGYDTATYQALDAIVSARDSISDLRLRLQYIFRAKGVAVSPIAGQSNIFIGSPL